MVRHQEADAERADHVDVVADLEVAEIVAGDAANRAALVILEHPLHRQRRVVVSGPLAVAGARDRILPRVMRPPLRVDPRGNDSDRLALQQGERHRAEIEHDMVGVVFLADLRHPDVAGDRRRDRLLRRARPIEIGVRVGRGPGRDDGRIVGDIGGVFSGDVGVAGRNLLVDRRVDGCDADGGELLGGEFGRKRVPIELRLDAVGVRSWHDAPIVDAAGRTGRDAGHAEVALLGVDHVVARVVGDRADRAGRLAGVAADADFRIDQVLSDDRCVDVLHALSPEALRPYSSRTRPFRPCHRPSARPSRRRRSAAEKSSSATPTGGRRRGSTWSPAR